MTPPVTWLDRNGDALTIRPPSALRHIAIGLPGLRCWRTARSSRRKYAPAGVTGRLGPPPHTLLPRCRATTDSDDVQAPGLVVLLSTPTKPSWEDQTTRVLINPAPIGHAPPVGHSGRQIRYGRRRLVMGV